MDTGDEVVTCELLATLARNDLCKPCYLFLSATTAPGKGEGESNAKLDQT